MNRTKRRPCPPSQGVMVLQEWRRASWDGQLWVRLGRPLCSPELPTSAPSMGFFTFSPLPRAGVPLSSEGVQCGCAAPARSTHEEINVCFTPGASSIRPNPKRSPATHLTQDRRHLCSPLGQRGLRKAAQPVCAHSFLFPVAIHTEALGEAEGQRKVMGHVPTCGPGSECAAFTGRVTHPRSLLSTWHDLQGLTPPPNAPKCSSESPMPGTRATLGKRK